MPPFPLPRSQWLKKHSFKFFPMSFWISSWRLVITGAELSRAELHKYNTLFPYCAAAKHGNDNKSKKFKVKDESSSSQLVSKSRVLKLWVRSVARNFSQGAIKVLGVATLVLAVEIQSF